ncbi:hypothetical protein CAEBREN_17060 [Caenorhabditis brenneri]|uniref:Uncharacterized protein n=1 Tax=Caenorhabditis brenneri TaxID=135651 RepID=G0MZY4_CAEBE|nr:hypothetical protein CAEBREN_17060 [Caenorhabditis brenneri]
MMQARRLDKTFSFVNLKESCPQKRLEMELLKLGVTGSNVRMIPMPTLQGDHICMPFDVDDLAGRRRMQEVIRSQNWIQLYSIHSLNSDHPFFCMQQTKESLLGTIILAATP